MLNLHIEKKSHLDKHTIKKMKEFVQQNNEDTGFPEFFYWDAIEHRLVRKHVNMDWLCYVDGELIAYLAIYYFSDSVLEINISLQKSMHQHSREILEQLYNELYNGFSRYRLHGSIFKLNFEHKLMIHSLQDLGASLLSYSKYMQRDVVSAKKFDKTVLSYNKADNKHIDIVAEIQSECYDINKNEYIEFFTHSLSNPNREAYVFYLSNDPVGKVHVLHDGDQVLIEEVCILPYMKDKGYELAMLQEICSIMQNKKSLLIEIDEEFDSLNKLYKELDFHDVAFIHNYYKELRPRIDAQG